MTERSDGNTERITDERLVHLIIWQSQRVETTRDREIENGLLDCQDARAQYNALREAVDNYHEALGVYFNAPTDADTADARRVLYRLYKVEMYARKRITEGGEGQGADTTARVRELEQERDEDRAWRISACKYADKIERKLNALREAVQAVKDVHATPSKDMDKNTIYRLDDALQRCYLLIGGGDAEKKNQS